MEEHHHDHSKCGHNHSHDHSHDQSNLKEFKLGTRPQDVPVDLEKTLTVAMKNRNLGAVSIPALVQKKIVYTLLDENPAFYEMCSIINYEWRSSVFSYFESKRTNNMLTRLELMCYLALLLDSRFSDKPSNLIDELRTNDIKTDSVYKYYFAKRITSNHTWGPKYEDFDYKQFQNQSRTDVVFLTNSSTDTKSSGDSKFPDSEPNYMVTPLAECTISTGIWDKPYELTMNSLQYAILEAFESDDEVKLDDLAKKLKATRFQLEYPLLSLVAIGLMNFKGKALSLNDKFSSQKTNVDCCTLPGIRTVPCKCV